MRQSHLSLLIALGLLNGCFSSSTPKLDPNDAASVADPGSALILDAGLGLKADVEPDVQPIQEVVAPPTDVPSLADATGKDSAAVDVVEDTEPADAMLAPDLFDATVPADAALPKVDIANTDAGPACEGINCPGTPAPSWALMDFQPASSKLGEVYGLDAFTGKVTVMVLLAGW